MASLEERLAATVPREALEEADNQLESMATQLESKENELKEKEGEVEEREREIEELRVAAAPDQSGALSCEILGYLAHKKPPPPLGAP